MVQNEAEPITGHEGGDQKLEKLFEVYTQAC
jgi:hypothetical protein